MNEDVERRGTGGSHSVSTMSSSAMLTVFEDPVRDLQNHSDGRTCVQTSVALEIAGQNT